MKHRKLTTISSLLSGAAAAALLAGTLNAGTPTAYASQLAAIGGTANTGVQVQNLSPSAGANITMNLYPQAGGNAVALSRTAGVESSANFYLPGESSVPAGAYGAVLASDQPIAAISRTEWTSGGRAGAATYESVPPSQSVSLPLLTGPTGSAPTGYANQISQFTIQNAGASGDTVTVEVFRVGSAAPIISRQYPIGAGTSRTFTLGQGDFANLPDTQNQPRGFVGYARIRSASAANPLVVQSFIDLSNSSKAVYAFTGVADSAADFKLFAPLVRRDYFGTSGISLVNPGATAASVQITYFNDPLSPSKLPGGSVSETVTVPANSSILVYQGPRPGNPLPDPDVGTGQVANNNGFFGSAQMVSTQPILGVVNDAVINNSFATQTDGAYNAARQTDGATRLFTPLIRRRHTSSLLTTGVQVQNVGNAPTNITISFKLSNGAPAGSQTINNVPAGASVNFYQDAADSPFPAGNFGSGVITSTGGQPIVAIVNDFSLTGGLDAAINLSLK